MRKGLIITSLCLLVLFFIIIALILSLIGYQNLRHIYTLHTSGHTVIKIEDNANGYSQYITRDWPAELLKDRMSNQGWSFVQQEGAGYFFEKAQEQVIVTIKKWNRYYYIITVLNDIMDIHLAD